jgi:hypothetical protein|tara:strand:- start:461 stop:712 length:252 start_codon:yes stop_codon:yes gene_type:complete
MTQDFSLSGKGMALAFVSGALIAGGGLVLQTFWEKKEVAKKKTIAYAATAGAALNLGFYLWLPSVFRQSWQSWDKIDKAKKRK